MLIKRKEAEKLLEEAFYNWLNSDCFKEMQRIRHLLHDYSFWNIVLMLHQRPDVSMVAGYKKWKKLGRHVKKGEKGMKILAPILKKVKEYDEEKEGFVEKEILMGFIPVTVFDIAQTDGKEISEPEFEAKGEVDEEKLIKFIKNQGYRIEYYHDDIAKGYVYRNTKTIHLRDDLLPLETASVLIHEWAHLNAGHFNLERDEEEIVVQVTSFFTLLELGADVSNYSAQYIQSWAESNDFDKIKYLFSKSVHLADKFINLFNNSPVTV